MPERRKGPKKLVVDKTYKVLDAEMWKLKRPDGTYLSDIYVDTKKNVKPVLTEIAKHIGIENISRMKKQELVNEVQKYLKFSKLSTPLVSPSQTNRKHEKTIKIEYETDDNETDEEDYDSDVDDSIVRFEKLMKRMKAS